MEKDTLINIGTCINIEDKQKNEILDTKPLAARITDYLQTEIINNNLKPGEQLKETELAKLFGTSRAPIREAFRMLERNGFVEVVPRKGAFVRRYTTKEIEDIYKVRCALEILALEIALSRLCNEDFIKLEKLISNMAEAMNKGDVKTYFKYNVLFHRNFFHIADNPVLNEIFERLSNPLLGLRLKSLSLPESLKESYMEHINIFNAIRERNVELAKKYLEAHIVRAMKKLKQCVAENCK
ncbi:GntR family transcriptional regulator [Calderihabitans maritimus]|uniref:GntR family transcriptional regulator n=1 Tax=Calderihabitans maritimus TaxID=1246530 RepID=A0A1Z5HVJ6_9FIRM|nr:GntR family transcriptional regulator [Calderihabitans maritimus]GAW93552.1 GntR family transcriptional regulator [Calderihabitans maritimus]